MKLRTHSEPLPKGVDRVVSLFKRAMQLNNVVRVEVTADEFIVTRQMDNEEDPVLPKTETKLDVDLEYLLGHVELTEAAFTPDTHPYLNLTNATERLTNNRLKISGLLAPRGDTFSDFFGLAEHSMPETFLGMRVIYHENEKYPDKLLVLGGPTVYFNDASHGVIIDMGI